MQWSSTNSFLLQHSWVESNATGRLAQPSVRPLTPVYLSSIDKISTQFHCCIESYVFITSNHFMWRLFSIFLQSLTEFLAIFRESSSQWNSLTRTCEYGMVHVQKLGNPFPKTHVFKGETVIPELQPGFISTWRERLKNNNQRARRRFLNN